MTSTDSVELVLGTVPLSGAAWGSRVHQEVKGTDPVIALSTGNHLEAQGGMYRTV